MDNWRTRLKVKNLFSSVNVEPAKAQEIGTEVAYRLDRDCAFDPVITRRLAERFRNVGNQEQFNDAMNDLYDAADAERVWLE